MEKDFENFMQTLDEQLCMRGFQPFLAPDPLPGFYFYIEQPICYIIHVAPKSYFENNKTVQNALIAHIEKQLSQLYCKHIVSLEIVITNGEVNFSTLFAQPNDSNDVHRIWWQYRLSDGQILCPDGHPNQLIHIEDALAIAAGRKSPAPSPEPLSLRTKKPIVCAIIFAICVFTLLYGELFLGDGEVYLRFGLSRIGIVSGQYYRLITSMFFHSGIVHLLSNSVYLYYFGTKLERILGHGKFILLYLLCGLGGGIASLLAHNVWAVGASGALFGVLAGAIVITKKYGSQFSDLPLQNIITLSIFAIGYGFLMPDIDNYAHLGGFLTGAIVTYLLTLRPRHKIGG